MPRHIVAAGVLAVVLAAPALARQDSGDLERTQEKRVTEESQEVQGRPEQRQAPTGGQAGERSPEDLPMSQLSMAQGDTIKGSTVRNQQGESIGDVQDVVVDLRRGQVAYAVVGVGGFLGVGEKNVAVPWDRLQPGDEPQSFQIQADRQTLENAPAIDLEDMATLQDPQARRQVSQFWQDAERQQAATPPDAPKRDEPSPAEGR